MDLRLLYPIRLVPHSFEPTRIGGRPTVGVSKNAVTPEGLRALTIDCLARRFGADMISLPTETALGFPGDGAAR
jgi:hypothetical protein